METKTSLIAGIRNEFASLEPAEQAKVIKALPKNEQIHLLHNVLIPGEYYPCILLLNQKMLLDEIMARGNKLAIEYVTKRVLPEHDKLVELALREHKFSCDLWKHLDNDRLITHMKSELATLDSFWSKQGPRLHWWLANPEEDVVDEGWAEVRKHNHPKAFSWIRSILSHVSEAQLPLIWFGLDLVDVKKLIGLCSCSPVMEVRDFGSSGYAHDLAFGAHYSKAIHENWSLIAQRPIAIIKEILAFFDECVPAGVATIQDRRSDLLVLLFKDMSLEQLTKLHHAGFKELMSDRQLFEVRMNGKEGKKLGSLSKAKAYVREGKELPIDMCTRVRGLPLGKQLQLLVVQRS